MSVAIADADAPTGDPNPNNFSRLGNQLAMSKHFRPWTRHSEAEL